MTLHPTRPCRACGAPIYWGLTNSGRKIPLDPAPTPTGNLAFRDDGRVVSDHGFPTTAPRYVSHFVTCPRADEFRRR